MSLVKDGTLIAKVIADSLKLKKEIDYKNQKQDLKKAEGNVGHWGKLKSDKQM